MGKSIRLSRTCGGLVAGGAAAVLQFTPHPWPCCIACASTQVLASGLPTRRSQSICRRWWVAGWVDVGRAALGTGGGGVLQPAAVCWPERAEQEVRGMPALGACARRFTGCPQDARIAV